jgi:cytochrome c oxidase subunit 3
LPLVNTLLLLSSGVTITLAHHAILKANNYFYHQLFAKHLLVTIILGATFLACQGIEYKYGVTFS